MSLSLRDPPTTFLGILTDRAAVYGHTRHFTFLRDGELKEEVLTFRDLYDRTLTTGRQLRSLGSSGCRAILLYPAGLEVLVAFFGCHYAGLIPVPVSLPNRRNGFESVRRIAEDSGASWILSSKSVIGEVGGDFAADPVLSALPLFDTSGWTMEDHQSADPAPLDPNSPALLQYTSGSTGTPRGVSVTHRNLVHNHRLIDLSFGGDSGGVVASWLPIFHDMGLGTVLAALCWGASCVSMAPRAFLQKPIRWLATISRYRATWSGGPDFAYDLCTRRINEEEQRGLDLSSWRVAYNGSEPVRAATLAQFARKFSACGFRREAFHPVFGLAEATLLVASEPWQEPPVIRAFSSEALARGYAEPEPTETAQESPAAREHRLLVSCGRGWSDTDIRIVNPDTLEVCGARAVGEIWVRSPSVASGYWGKESETKATFDATTSGGEGPFLRTGDLGFFQDGHLFITGRFKDLIIVRGQNHYPQDIEATVSTCHPALEPYGCAAFSLEEDESENLIIIQEVSRRALRRLDPDPIFWAIRRSVSNVHALKTRAILLVPPASLPRTTSGKIRHKACREAFLNRLLPAVATWQCAPEAGLTERPLVASLSRAGATPPTPGGVTLRSAESTGDPGAELNRFKPAATEQQTTIPSLPETETSCEQLLQWIRESAPLLMRARASGEDWRLPPSLVEALGRQRLFGLQASRRLGGLDLGCREAVRVIEQLAAVDLILGLFVSTQYYLGAEPIARYGGRALREELLPDLISGKLLAGFALGEPVVGFEPTDLASYAVATGDGAWQLYGTKWWTGFVDSPGVISVFVRHPQSSRVSAFALRRGIPGVRLVHESRKAMIPAFGPQVMVLDGVSVGLKELLGTAGAGMEVAESATRRLRLAVGAVCVGGLKRAAQLGVGYAAKGRTPQGKPLLVHPVTLARLGPMTAGIATLECLVHRVARAIDAGETVPEEAFAVCKMAGPELLWRGLDDLVQLVGDQRATQPTPILRWHRSARMLRILEGRTEVVTTALGECALSNSQGLTRALGEFLSAPHLVPVLDQSIEAVRARYLRPEVAPERDVRYRALTRAGDLAAWIVLLGAVEGERRRVASASLARAAAWARANFERSLSFVQRGTPSEAVILGPAAIAETVAAYSEAIGDLALAGSNPSGGVDEARLVADQGRAPASSPRPRAEEVAARRELRRWVVDWLARYLRTEPSRIAPHRSFADHGMDSLGAVELSRSLSEKLGCELDETLLWHAASIDALVEQLIGAPPKPGQLRPEANQAGTVSRHTPDQDLLVERELDDEIERLELELRRQS